VASDNKNITLDETAFIIGSGPSLNEIDISLLKDLDTFGMNRQYIAFEDWGFEPKYYCMCDAKLISAIFDKDIVEKYVKDPLCKIQKYFISQIHNWEPLNEKVNSIFRFSSMHEYSLGHICERTKNPFPTIPGEAYGNCGLWATCISYILGYKRAVLLGIDCTYGKREESVEQGKDLEHFHPEYFDPKSFFEGDTHGNSEADGGLAQWETVLEHINSMKQNYPFEFEIISSSPKSSLNEMLEYVPLEEILDGKR
jgi:hypothetical protein